MASAGEADTNFRWGASVGRIKILVGCFGGAYKNFRWGASVRHIQIFGGMRRWRASGTLKTLGGSSSGLGKTYSVIVTMGYSLLLPSVLARNVFLCCYKFVPL